MSGSESGSGSGVRRRTRTTLRRVVACAALVGVGAVATASVAAATPTPVKAHRENGADRYETAALMEVPSRDVAYLVTGSAWADGVTAGALAGRPGANVFLTPRGQLPPSVRNVIGLYRKVVVVGGENAISADVWTWLHQNTRAQITRVAGADRYATAAALSATGFAPGVSEVVVATGADYADALAGSSAAVRSGAPVLLVSKDAVPEVVRAELTRLAPKKITVLGGTASVSDRVAADLAQFATEGVRRLAGDDRYATAVTISQAYFPAGARAVRLASGTSWPDAVAAGVRAAHQAGPLLLSPQYCLPQSTNVEIERLQPQFFYAVGGVGSLAGSAVARTDCGAVPSTYLADLAAPTGNAAVADGHAFLGGTFYPRATVVTTDPRNSEYRSWALGGGFSRFTSTVGIADGVTSGLTSRVEVFGDEVLLGTYDVAVGRTARIDVSVRGVQNLKVVTTSSARTSGADALGDSVFLGDAGLN